MTAIALSMPQLPSPRRPSGGMGGAARDRRLRAWLLIAVLVGMMAGFLLGRWTNAATHRPRLSSPSPAPPVAPPVTLQASVAAWLERLRAAGQIDRAALVFRDLRTGAGFELNAGQRFHPASLLKLPLALRWLRKAEQDPAVLARRLTWPADAKDLREDAAAPQALHPGEAYTVADLVQRLIVYSRNDARALLAWHLDADELLRTYAELGLDVQTDADGDFTATVRTLATLLERVHAGRTLGQVETARVMELLEHTQFRAGLVAGLPPGVPVAHKFGVRLERDGAGRVTGAELHDCGIVRPNERAYLLCVMTAGHDVQHLAGAIASVTRAVHAAVAP